MNSKQALFNLLMCVLAITSCDTQKQGLVGNELAMIRAKQTLDSLYRNYSVSGTCLLRENYPSTVGDHTVTYLASEEQKNMPHLYSYLWPYSGTFSAVNALFETTSDASYQSLLDNKVLVGLEEYFDTHRTPEAYASYINSAPKSDRFYDDNVWLGIDFIDIYMLTKETKYLQKAQLIWNFVESGMDNHLGGGIYWCEQKKDSKNTCSNAPGSVLALKLFKATKDSAYFVKGQRLYEWTKANLQDSTDYLYFDNIALDGKIGKAKFAYNSGQMMQSATLLYQLSGEKNYLTDARNIAQACHNYFFMDYETEQGKTIKLLKKGDIWFTAVMLRGFIELYRTDLNKIYLDSFNQSLDHAWVHARDEKGLFNTDLSGSTHNNRKWLLTQAAMVEMYARLAAVK
ncbi:glycoside hydrolase family 76 protein [Bacteroides sp. UBA939]|uniref:glycoside hydrolase family 76 protein n=1 Tax=Bacteroides sp. UBA939 TaxID=1946092 RepID=UPI0025BFB1B6|nr:glycoside hydrolase family 76 protein [Bacteroides sp. UBA939]